MRGGASGSADTQSHRAARPRQNQPGHETEDGAARADVAGHVERAGDEHVQIRRAVCRGEL